LNGIDATASAVEYARKHSASYPEISFTLADVLSSRIGRERFDVVISSLFTHHFREDDWIRLVGKMYACATRAVIINDLHRHWFAYHAIGILTRLLSRSELVKHDSKVSVLRGFRRKELMSMLEKAGITNYTIRWKWAFRWQVILYK
jgi:2-polyprenyl-3-methyl-5-hydroxy-6-metoxy-1,4-benzoquinol methylase